MSRDTGFDPLVKHLTGLKIACKRIAQMEGTPKPSPKIAVAALATPPAANKAVIAKAKAKNVSVTILPEPNGKTAAPPKPPAASANHVNVVVARLMGMKAARPVKLATLQSSLKAWFKPALTDKQLAEVIKALTESKKVRLDGTKVTYALG